MLNNERKTSIRIKKDIFQKLWEKGVTLFFFNREKKWDGLVRDYVTIWKPENLAISTTPYGHVFSNIFNDIAFIYGKPCQSSNTTISDDLVEMECEEFDPKNISHVKSVFRLHFLNKENKQDKYACRELLWYLNNYYIDFDLLLRVFNGFEASLVRPFFLNELKKYSYCLSIPKQDLIQRLISHFNGTYNIYVPSELLNALRVIDSNYNPYTDWKSNIFDLVDKATFELKNRDSDKKYNVLEDNSISNIFLKIRRWLLDDSYTFTEFDKLQKLIRLFAPKQQLRLLNRYFLAVKKQQTSFDIELIKQFKDNKFDNWGIYYHCACTASKPVPIGLQILCDCLLTFLSTNGTALQTINGILDLAFSKCNVNSPAIDFQLKNIVPICNGGAIPNKNNFKGFICYEIIQIINEDYFDKYDCISELAQNIISTLSNNQDYKEKCVIHNDSSICQKKTDNSQSCTLSDCKYYCGKYPVKWTFVKPSQEKCEIVNLFLKNPLLKEGVSSEIILEDINTNLNEIRQKIHKFINLNLKKKESYNKFPEGYIYPNSCCYEYKYFFDRILKSVWMIIEPRNNVYIGLGLLARTINVKHSDYANKERLEEIQRKEFEYLRPKIMSSIQSIVNVSAEKDGKFYLEYNEELLRQLQADFYSTKPVDSEDKFNNKDLCFLYRNSLTYISYCCPEYTGLKNRVINLPYYDCRGRECYFDALSEQVLEECSSWENFKIFHILEILGYPQIKKTEAGFESSKLIRDFIGMVNKASQLYKRVICRECGHILFPIKKNEFNRYNNFECHNPICVALNKKTYLNQCHHCKKGIIDSRDSHQCSNGWRICPTCLSCCTDIQIEQQAQKYERRGYRVPDYIQRTRLLGHNDKHQYFCPKCGGKIIKHYDSERNELQIFCNECRETYRQAVEWL